MSYFEINGGLFLGMKGKNCVLLASDRRLGQNQLKTVAMNFNKHELLTNKTMVAACGLAADAISFQKTLQFHHNLYELREDRIMPPAVLANFTGKLMYKRRFAPYYIETCVAGLTEKNEPYLCKFDCLGASCDFEDFVATGAGQEQLYGTCEAFYQKDLGPDDLFECACQCFLASLDRACFSGWGATVTIITPEEVIEREIQVRMD